MDIVMPIVLIIVAGVFVYVMLRDSKSFVESLKKTAENQRKRNQIYEEILTRLWEKK